MCQLFLNGCGMDLVMVWIIVALCIKCDIDECVNKRDAADNLGLVMVWLGYSKGA